MDAPQRREQPTVALVLGAGGSSGSAFLAAALDELCAVSGFAPEHADRIVGTSAGAFRAARTGQAAGPPSPDVIAALADLANNDEWTPGRVDYPVVAVRRAAGRLIARLAPRRRPAPRYTVAPPPFHAGARVVTVERTTGRRAVHDLATTGDPRAAVIASGAVPGAVGPVEIGGELHVDGAVHSPTNADLIEARETGGVLIVIAPMVPRSGGNPLGRIHRILLRHELAAWRQHPTVVIAPSRADRRHRRNAEFFGSRGAPAVRRLTARRPSGLAHRGF